MLINVMYTDHRFDMIKADRLEGFIRRGDVFKFKRSTGWGPSASTPYGSTAPQGTSPSKRNAARLFRRSTLLKRCSSHRNIYSAAAHLGPFTRDIQASHKSASIFRLSHKDPSARMLTLALRE